MNLTTIMNILKNAGWSECRNVDISSIVNMYNENGYIYSKKQLSFMNRYAFLKIDYMHPLWNEKISLVLDPIKAQESIFMSVVKSYEEYLNEHLIIIGEICEENMTLYLSNKGIFYAGYDNCIINFGVSFEKMLYNLANGIKGDLILID